MFTKRFDLVYKSGARVSVRARECIVTKEGDLITHVKFNNVSKWVSFTITDLIAVVQR